MATKNKDLIETWRKLQTSDHFYYMCTKWSADGDVHAYFSPYQSPYDAYIAFMNALSDLQLRVSHALALSEEKAKVREERKRAEVKTETPLEVKPEPMPITTTWQKLKNWCGQVVEKSPFLRRFLPQKH